MKFGFLVAPTLFLCLHGQAEPRLKLGDPAPAFHLPGVDGKALDSKGIKGPFVVVFLSTQCPYVLGIDPRMVALTRQFEGKVRFIAINSNESDSPQRREEGLDGMKAHARKVGYPFPYLKDESQEVIKAYGAVCTPDFFLFDAQRKLVYRGRFDASRPGNPHPVTGADLRAACDALLARKPIARDQKPSIGCNIKWRAGHEPDWFG